jgi:ribosomal protection tetracycline resistance protein
LAQLAEQDPLINLRQDDLRQEVSVSLYGEVQKEVIQATLANDFGIEVGFAETTTICIERPAGTGEAVETIGKDANPFVATIGLRVEPAPLDTGIDVRLEVKLESIPLYVYKSVESFRHAIEETVQETLSQGIHGWRVTDCVVTVTESGYVPPVTSAKDVRLLTPLVLMKALRRAGTVVCEPIHRFHLEVPPDTVGSILPVLARLSAVPRATTMHDSAASLDGEIPSTRIHDLQQRLPALTRGEGVLDSHFDHYQSVRGTIPSRPRSDNNPLNRKEYLLHVLRRTGGPQNGAGAT